MDFFSLILFFILGTPAQAPHYSHQVLSASESDTDRGAGLDPDGMTSEEGDRGPGLDPDGLVAGAEIDPDGAI